jgi:hypothetical protein
MIVRMIAKINDNAKNAKEELQWEEIIRLMEYPYIMKGSSMSH